MKTIQAHRQIFRDELKIYLTPSSPFFKTAIAADKRFIEWEVNPTKKNWARFLNVWRQLKQ